MGRGQRPVRMDAERALARGIGGQPRMSLVGNVTTKLTANALDRASTSCLSAGVLVPVAGYLYDRGRFSVI